MFMVVTLHAALGYIRINIPELIWASKESPEQVLFDPFCWWVMGVSSPLFFTIAGFFAADLFESRGPAGFLKNRWQRILAPFLVSSATILPLCLAVWEYGWLESGRCTWREIRRMKFHARGLQPNLYGPAHLWFLEYLMVMLSVFFAYKMIERRIKASNTPPEGESDRSWLLSPLRPLLLAVPTALIVWMSREASGIDAFLNRHNSFLVDPMRLALYGVFFTVGAVLQRHSRNLDLLIPHSMTYLTLSIPVFIGRAVIMREGWLRPLSGVESFASSGLAALYSWLVIFGLFGTYLRLINRSNGRIRYLADSSYWIYLWHFPVVGLIQVDLLGAPLHPVVKFATVLLLTFSLGFSSYQVMVRYTWVGRWLHGARKRPEVGEPSFIPLPRFRLRARKTSSSTSLTRS